jgi:hypothetical protein
MEMVKITQSMVFIAKDREMYYAPEDEPALARWVVQQADCMIRSSRLPHHTCCLVPEDTLPA